MRIRPLTRKIGGWWRICYHNHPTPDHYTSAATANNAARYTAKVNAWR